jgi:hypothetical protein
MFSFTTSTVTPYFLDYELPQNSSVGEDREVGPVGIEPTTEGL